MITREQADAFLAEKRAARRARGRLALSFVVIAALVGGVALAAAIIDPVPHAQHFLNGGYFGTKTLNPTLSAQNLIADSRGTYFAYTFGTITAPLWQTGGCVDGPTITKSGVIMGDTCTVATDRTIWDGGRPANFYPTCEVPGTGFILLKGCVYPNDAGVVVTAVDAGYYIRTFGFTQR